VQQWCEKELRAKRTQDRSGGGGEEKRKRNAVSSSAVRTKENDPASENLYGRKLQRMKL